MEWSLISSYFTDVFVLLFVDLVVPPLSSWCTIQKDNLESDGLASFRKIGALCERERERGAKSIAEIIADN